jgi:hypothetical protein
MHADMTKSILGANQRQFNCWSSRLGQTHANGIKLHILQADKPPKDETEEQRMLRLEMESLAAEQKAQMQAVSVVWLLSTPCRWTSASTQAVGVGHGS